MAPTNTTKGLPRVPKGPGPHTLPDAGATVPFRQRIWILTTAARQPSTVMALLQRYDLSRLYRSTWGATSWIQPFSSGLRPTHHVTIAAQQRVHHQWPPIFPATLTTPYSLSEEQRFVLNLALRGENLFFTGSAGTRSGRDDFMCVSYADRLWWPKAPGNRFYCGKLSRL